MRELLRSQIRQLPWQRDPPLTDIQKSQCLSSLDIHLHDTTVISRSGLEPIFLKTARLCRNLRDLSMKISTLSGPVPHHIINTDGGRRLNLRSLAIIYYVRKLFDQRFTQLPQTLRKAYRLHFVGGCLQIGAHWKDYH